MTSSLRRSSKDSRVRVGDAIGTSAYTSTIVRLTAITEFAKINATNVDIGYRQFGEGGCKGVTRRLAEPMGLVWYTHPVVTVGAVSYTHLTLPTIYSV